MSNKAAVATEAGKPLVTESREIQQPKPSEVIIKNHAIAINPADWKMRDSGVFVESFPIILGSDVAGVVESVGSEVKNFEKGDRVGGFAHVLISKDSRNGAFQQYSAVEESGTFKVAADLPFDKAAMLPMAIATAGLGIFLDLEVPRLPAKQSGGFLVWGGASSVGSAAVQIARAAGYKVYATASTRHHDYLKTLGASQVFDYGGENVVNNVVEAAKAAGDSINIGYDPIAEHGTSPLAASILQAFGGGKLCTVLPFPEDAQKPSNVTTHHTFAARVVGDQRDLGTWLFGEWLAESLVNGTIKPSPAIQIVEGGLEAGIEKALGLSKQGVSGKKLIVPI